MSLADQIVERNSNSSPNQEIDEFGIPIPTPETPEYLVARALILHQPGNADPLHDIHCLHLRNGALYLGHTPLRETKKTILELTRLKRSLKDWEEVEFWRLLKQYIPRLNRRFLIVGENCYWDIEKAELINAKEAQERSKE